MRNRDFLKSKTNGTPAFAGVTSFLFVHQSSSIVMPAQAGIPFGSQKGFTLVELSIVLVIIGLIIGGVVGGQQIIENARITNAINGIQAYQAQFQTYSQNYGALPGDDPSATTRFPSLADANDATAMLGNGDGKVGDATSFNTEDTGNESSIVWAHLRAAGLVKNQVTTGGAPLQPSNPFGGVYGFQNGAFSGTFTTTVLCLNKLPAGAAQAIDGRIDDGASDQGSIQAAIYGDSDVSSAPVSAYTNGQTYTLCVRM